MSIPVEVKSSASISSTNPFYLTMPTHVAGDLLLVVGHGRYSAATVTCAAGTALTSIGNQTNCSALWKIAESSSEVFSSNYASAQAWQVICIQGAHATAPIKGSAYTSITGGAYSIDSGTIDTTGDDDCLIVHAHHCDSGSGYRNPFIPRTLVAPASGYSSVSCSFEVRHGAGVSTARKLWGSTNAGGSWQKVYSIAIKNRAADPIVDLSIKSHPQIITQWGGALGASGLTVQAPNAVATMTLLDGIKPYTAGSTNGVAFPAGWANSIQLSESAIPTVAGGYTGGAWMGTIWSLTSTIDIDGKTVMFPVRYTPNWDGRTGADGTALLLVDSSDNWVAFQLHPLTEILENIDFHFLLSCSALTPWKSYGTMAWNSLKRWGFLHHRTPDSSGYTNYLHTYAPTLLDAANPAVIVGHYAGAVSIARMYSSLYAGAGGIGHTFKQGRGQLIVRMPLQLGDGTNKTAVLLSGQSIEFPAVDASLHRISNNSINMTIYASANDTMNFAASILATEIRQTMTIHASSSVASAGIYNFAGASIIGWDWVHKTGATCDLATFSGCYTIDGKAHKFGTCTYSGCLLTSAAYLRLDGGVDTDNKSGAVSSSFTKGTEDYAVELRTAGYYDFTDTTFSGYTNELYISGPAGTYTITLAVGQTQPDVYNPNSRTIVWDVPTVDVTFGPLEAGSQVVVFEQGTTTEMFRTDSSGTSEVWAGATGDYDYTVMKAGLLPVRGSGASPTASITIDPQQKVDWAYVASSVLVFADLAFDFTNNYLKCNIATTPQNLYSFLIESWIAEASLVNKDFIMTPNGPNGFALIDGWETRGFTTAGTGINNTTLSNLSRDGLRYLNGTTETAVWAAILTSGVPTGKQVRYQQSDNGATISAVNTGNMDQLVQTYGDATHGNFDKRSYLVLKVQAEGYDQTEVDAYALYGSLGAQLYSIGLTPAANGIATGDPALTITISQGTYTEDGKTFSVKIVDNVTPSSGTDILRELRYNFAAGGAYQGEDAFNWHDLVQTNGSKFKTVRGTVYGTAAVKGVLVYMADGVTLHPDFNLFTADDGTTVTPSTTVTLAWASAAIGTMILIYNDSQAGVLVEDGSGGVLVSTGYSRNFTLPHVDLSVGDTLRLRYASKTEEAGEITGVLSADGLTFLETQATDAAYAAWGLDGAAMSEFSADLTNIDIDIAGGGPGVTFNSQKKRIGAWWKYILTTPAGLDAFYGAFTFAGPGSIRQNVSVVDVKLQETSGAAIVFTDNNVRYYRSDNSCPYDTTPGFGSMFIDYDGQPYTVATGSGVTPTDKTEIATAVRSELATELAATMRNEKFARNKQILDPADGSRKVYDNDGTTILGQGDAFMDVAGTQPYDGSGPVHRTERLA